MNKAIKWNTENKAVKATQVAFEMEQQIARKIHKMAVEEGMSPSSKIRKLLQLSYSLPKRPRLTVSLSSEDYDQLGKRYKIDPGNTLEIKRRIMSELINLVKNQK